MCMYCLLVSFYCEKNGPIVQIIPFFVGFILGNRLILSLVCSIKNDEDSNEITTHVMDTW